MVREAAAVTSAAKWIVFAAALLACAPPAASGAVFDPFYNAGNHFLNVQDDGTVYFENVLEVIKLGPLTLPLILSPICEYDESSGRCRSAFVVSSSESWLIPRGGGVYQWHQLSGRDVLVGATGSEYSLRQNGEENVVAGDDLEFCYRGSDLVAVKRKNELVLDIESGAGRVLRIKDPTGGIIVAFTWSDTGRIERLFTGGKGYIFTYEGEMLRSVGIYGTRYELIAEFSYEDGLLTKQRRRREQREMAFRWASRPTTAFAPVERVHFKPAMLAAVDSTRYRSYVDRRGIILEAQDAQGVKRRIYNPPSRTTRVED